MLILLTVSVASSQEQAMCEPEPMECPFLPWEVRLGSQNFGVTIQKYALTRAYALLLQTRVLPHLLEGC